MEGMGNSPCPSKHSPKIHGSQSKIETPEHRSKQGNFTCWETKPKLWLWQWCYKRVTRNSDTGAALLLDAIKNFTQTAQLSPQKWSFWPNSRSSLHIPNLPPFSVNLVLDLYQLGFQTRVFFPVSSFLSPSIIHHLLRQLHFLTFFVF